MIRGANILNLDTKGRIAIPSRYRDALTERCDGKLVVTANNTKEHCLWLYPMDEWLKVEEKITSLSSFKAPHQRLQRLIIGYASDVDMDKSGRLLLPGPLREFAKLEQSVYLVGLGNKFEIWSEALWTARCDEWLSEEGDAEEITDEMGSLSL